MPRFETPHGTATVARLETILQRRREGRSYREIGTELSISSTKAQQLSSRAIRRLLRETAEEVRQLELSRLELLIGVLWEPAIADMTGPEPNAHRFDRLKGLIEAKLRWCGAVPTITESTDNRVQIVVQQFTTPPPSAAIAATPVPAADHG